MQMAIGIIYAILFWGATLVLVLGVANKIIIYAKVPAPLKIPVTPAPTNRSGVVLRMLQETLLFKSLFRADKLLWLISIIFHYSLLVIVLKHFFYVLEPINNFIILVYPYGEYAGVLFIITAICLLSRRFFIDRVRYISSPSDSAMLLLLIAIPSSGLFIKYVSYTDIVMVKSFFRGLIYFDWQPLPADFVLLLHLSLVLLLMFIFPISKLLHAPGVFFSPTHNQIDNPRDKRHISSWGAELERQENADIKEVDKS